MKALLYQMFSTVSGDRLAWKLTPDRLRILCYHGVCDDRVGGQPWVPSYFVTKSAFESQLGYLQREATVLPLSQAVRRLADGTLPPGAVSLTFDDGYGNNLHLAQPLLKRFGMTATVFLSTSYIETGDWYPFLKLKLLRLFNSRLPLPDYKSSPMDTLIRETAPYWPEAEAQLTADQRDTLRPMTIAEVRSADTGVLEFGAHSHTHCIARNETNERRRQEVRTSVRKVAEWAERPAGVFSYPNGEPGDFGDPEKETLRAEGVGAAVTGIGGANRRPCDPFELRRYPLTLYHDAARFRAEVTGFRTMLLSLGGAHA